MNTFVGPDGRLQWGGYLSGLRYDAVGPSNSNSPGFSKYIIRGTVVDEAGKGVGGIAIQIGDEIVLSVAGRVLCACQEYQANALKSGKGLLHPDPSLDFE